MPDGLKLSDCSVHQGNYLELKIEAQGETDWNQHDQWQCFYAQLAEKFEDARGTLREVYNEIYDYTHGEECPAVNCPDDCECNFKPVSEESEDEQSELPIAEQKDHAECTCIVGKLKEKVLAALKRTGGA